jgi:hypothetical protein
VTYGLTATSERSRLRNAAEKALVEIPELEAVSLESYEDHVISGKARFSSRETVIRNESELRYQVLQSRIQPNPAFERGGAEARSPSI